MTMSLSMAMMMSKYVKYDVVNEGVDILSESYSKNPELPAHTWDF